jgi:hypothetical protein
MSGEHWTALRIKAMKWLYVFAVLTVMVAEAWEEGGNND